MARNKILLSVEKADVRVITLFIENNNYAVMENLDVLSLCDMAFPSSYRVLFCKKRPTVGNTGMFFSWFQINLETHIV